MSFKTNKYLETSRNKYIKVKRGQRARYRERTGAFLYEARLWTASEDALVVGHSIPDRELSVLIKMSVGAIQGRRARLKANENNT